MRSDTLALLIFIFCYTLSALRSPFKELARNQSLVLFCALSLFWIGKNLAEESQIILQKTIALASTLFSFFYILSQTVPFSTMEKEGVEFYLNANLVCSFTILGLFVTINSIRSKSLLIVAMTFNLIAFYFTQSLGGLLGVIAALFYMACKEEFPIRGKIKMDRKLKFILVPLIFFAILTIFHSHWSLRSFTDRSRWWWASVQMLLQAPFWGAGPAAFEKVAPYYFDPGLKSLYAHSYLLQTASEVGLPAACSLFYFFFNRIKSASRHFLSAALLAVLTQNLFDFSMHVPGIFLLFWIIMAFALKDEGPQETTSLSEQASAPALNRFSAFLAFTFTAIAACFLGWRYGIKPLFAFQESLRAQVAFDKMDLESAEKHLRRSIYWDDLPAKYYSDCSLILTARYRRDPEDHGLIQAAVKMQKEALRREPLSLQYRTRLNELLRLK